MHGSLPRDKTFVSLFFLAISHNSDILVIWRKKVIIARNKCRIVKYKLAIVSKEVRNVR